MHDHLNFKFEFSLSVLYFTRLNKDYFPYWVSCQGSRQTSSREMLNTRVASGELAISITKSVPYKTQTDWTSANWYCAATYM